MPRSQSQSPMSAGAQVFTQERGDREPGSWRRSSLGSRESRRSRPWGSFSRLRGDEAMCRLGSATSEMGRGTSRSGSSRRPWRVRAPADGRDRTHAGEAVDVGVAVPGRCAELAAVCAGRRAGRSWRRARWRLRDGSMASDTRIEGRSLCKGSRTGRRHPGSMRRSRTRWSVSLLRSVHTEPRRHLLRGRRSSPRPRGDSSWRAHFVLSDDDIDVGSNSIASMDAVWKPRVRDGARSATGRRPSDSGASGSRNRPRRRRSPVPRGQLGDRPVDQGRHVTGGDRGGRGVGMGDERQRRHGESDRRRD